MIQATLEYENGTTHVQTLEADESKKSVYWLKGLPPAAAGSNSGNIKTLTIAADASNAFLIGGFQLQGMAKCVKVYVDDADKLVMSVRGIKSTRLQAFFKAQCVIPGGARPVNQFVRLELEPAAVIHQIRWTLRMRDQQDGGEGSASEGMMLNADESNSSVGDGIGLTSGMNGSTRGQDKTMTELPNDMLQSANTLVSTASTTVQHSAGLSAPAVASLTQHMADLASAMRELTATIKDHQQFLQEQQQQQQKTTISSEQEF